MNLSMFTCYALRQDFATPQDAFRHFYEKGIRYGDIIDDELAAIPLPLYAEFLTEAGMVPGSLISILDIASFSEKERRKNIGAIKAYIDQMEKLKIPLLMLAPEVRGARSADEFKRMQELLIDGFSQVVEYAKGSGVTVTIENQSVSVRADSKMQDIRYILDCVPDLSYVLDAGNFFCVGEDVLEAYDLLRDRLVHVHFKDWNWNPYGGYVRENMPRFGGVVLGQGLLPLSELVHRMKRDGYEGNIVLEINAGQITLEMLDASAEFLRGEIDV